MLAWAIATVTGFAAGIAVGILVRRERVFRTWLRGEVEALHEEVEGACVDLRALSTAQGRHVLDQIEGEESGMATNLDRMNALLDQLNGLLKGKTSSQHYGRCVMRGDDEAESLSEQLDFTSPEELLKFSALPPISEDEIRGIDWESLFRRIEGEPGE